MSTGVLEKLKIKPIPKKVEQIEIKFAAPLQLEPVTIRTAIIDNTKDKLINREDFIRKLTTMTVSSKRPTSKIQEVAPSPPKVPVKKLTKKLKLTSDLKESEPDTGIRKTPKPDLKLIADNINLNTIIGDTMLKDRLPVKDKKVLLRANAYYMNNRETFVNFINALFRPYKEEFDKVESSLSCDRRENAEFTLLTHQKVVRDYLNIYSPYRGLLLYHGLGSGKTCTSIAIAEGMKSDKQVVVMTPASLRMNYLEELKSCGDLMYKKNQYWEFVPVGDAIPNNTNMIEVLSSTLQLSTDFIIKHGGAWMVNVKKMSNYNELSENEKKSLNVQINEMLNHKYRFINYNGLLNSHLKALTMDYKINPFDDKVIIIDEAHNFVSRIVNKLKRPEALSMRLYEYLLSAENCRIVLLTGTPIINYPNEISILFNILRGYIKTWTFPLNIKTSRKINKEEIVKIFSEFEILDYIDYKPSSKLLTVTRNPFGFVNVNKDGSYKGVSNFKVGNRGNISDVDFVKIITSILNKNEIEINTKSIQVELSKSLPDSLESFQNFFIESTTGKLKNENLLKRRILGLTSYFKSAQEQLMPQFNRDIDMKVIKIPMSDFQFGVYEQARIQERQLEKAANKRKKKAVNPKDDVYDDAVSTYRIFSRAFCNFVFPTEKKRPMPKDGEDIGTSLEENTDEDILDALSVKERVDNPDGQYSIEDADMLDAQKRASEDGTYEQRIKDALKYLKDNESKYLSPNGLQTYSPKFLNILENIKDPEFRGLHLIYTQFRTLEGIGILKLILEANGFAQFKIKRDETGVWKLNMSTNDVGKPTFALYTGTESTEEKEIIRNIFNSNWNYVPDTITSELSLISTNNLYGEIIKVLMITASGAEGISLKNTRYVHIVEPYWHPVRIEQVIGRARRICSHQDLPPELRTVNVFLYLMTFTPDQISGDKSIQLRLNDGSKFDDSIPISSDEALYEISTIKENLSKQILTAVKEASMDCTLYTQPGNNNSIKCFSFGKTSPTSFSYKPSISNEESDAITDINKERITWKAKEVKIPVDGIKKSYAQNPTPTRLNPTTYDIYDLNSYNDAVDGKGDLVMIGQLIEKTAGSYKFVKI